MLLSLYQRHEGEKTFGTMLQAMLLQFWGKDNVPPLSEAAVASVVELAFCFLEKPVMNCEKML